MTLEKTLLQKLAEWRPDASSAPLQINEPADWTIRLNIDRNEEIAARVRQISLSRTTPVTDLRGWATRLCESVTGLLEPLALLEYDAAQGTAQLRSQGPTSRDGSVAYYEIVLTANGQACVQRFQAPARGGKRREAVGFALTHEVLARFVSDLIAAA